MCLKGLHPMTSDDDLAQKEPAMAPMPRMPKTGSANSSAGIDLGNGRGHQGKDRKRDIVKRDHARPPDRRRENKPISHSGPAQQFHYLRKVNPEFDQFVREHSKENNSRGQRIRYTRARNAAVRDDDNNDYGYYYYYYYY
jgi:hypothetical protein